LKEARDFGVDNLLNPEDCLLWKALTHTDELGEALFAFASEILPGAEQEELRDLIEFQKAVLITPDYDSVLGRSVRLQWNWPRYFRGEPLQRTAIQLRLHDQNCGTRRDYSLNFHRESHSERMHAFFEAAIGFIYHRQCRAYLRDWQVTELFRARELGCEREQTL
jgi:hypothetical protein